MKWLVLFVITLGLGLATPNSTYNHYRLLTALRPIKYDLHVLTQLEYADDFSFNGSVKIQIQVLENTNNITLHSKELTIDETATTLRQITGEDLKNNCVSSTETDCGDTTAAPTWILWPMRPGVDWRLLEEENRYLILVCSPDLAICP
uniref:IP07201p n=1 Tax=Drosophila melanogaster TaxID=7227 RepID=Q4V5F4_DROME|nr:IP07201p [Drosophila melanogaster]